jgi:hypothetical protein
LSGIQFSAHNKAVINDPEGQEIKQYYIEVWGKFLQLPHII